MGKPFQTIQQVVDSKLCSGCGACVYMQPDDLEMVDVPDEGLRPARLEGARHETVDTSEALAVCPGIELEHPDFSEMESVAQDLTGAWGPILSMWEGFASDGELRFAGSSGGVASALAAYSVERLGFELVLHVGADEKTPYLNRTVVSKTRDEVLRRTGSRYSPASPCDGLGEIERAAGPCLFIGKPCDVAAAQRARKYRPALDRNLAITVAFFCAGTPSTKGTLELLQSVSATDLESLGEVRYRGNGWPGKFVATSRDGKTIRSCDYEASWGAVLSKHVQWRCKLCLDHTGEFADIAVGDPWYRAIAEGEMGSSLIVARTELGRRFVEEAIEKGVLSASPVEFDLLQRSQANLLRTRGEVWGRLLGARLCGARTPTYRRMASFDLWRQLSPRRKLRSITGAVRRCIQQNIAFKA